MRNALALVLLLAACSSEKPSAVAQQARACLHDPDGACAIPILNVHSLRAAQRYYRDSLGFKLEWEDGAPPDFASVTKGKNGRIFMCQGCQGNPGTWVMLIIHDVDELYREYQERGVLVRMPPTNMRWGLREMHVSDLDGNVIRFGSPIDH